MNDPRRYGSAEGEWSRPDFVAQGEPSRMGRYEALARLGTGGMATVYVGRAQGDLGFSHLVALKRAHEHVRLDPDLIDGLKREARLASRIHHPNVVGVIDVQDDAGDVILVLDYVEGCTLSDLMRRIDTGQHPREMLRILLDTGAGLDAAHQTTDDEGQPLHLVHRDVSPSNVLIGRDGVARISDFGVAKSLARNAEETATGVLKGKLAYMAPEYVERHYVDARSDLFSLGIVAWELLTGDRLFKGPTELETLKRVALQSIPAPSAYLPHLAMLDPTILRALARHPDHRFNTVGAFSHELEMRARAANLVGSHIEVAKLVDEVYGAELTERRQRFAATSAASAPQMMAPLSGDSVAAGSHSHPTLDASHFTHFTQSAPAQSLTQSAIVAARSRPGATIPLSLLIVVLAIGSGVLLAHRMNARSAPPAAAAKVTHAPPPVDTAPAAPPQKTAESFAATFGAAEPDPPAAASNAPAASSAPAASASASAKVPTSKPAKRSPLPSNGGSSKADGATSSSPATVAPAKAPTAPRVIPEKPPPNPYGP